MIDCDRPIKMDRPFKRGCNEKFIINFTDKEDGKSEAEFVDLTNKVLYFTVKAKPWDKVADDSSKIFKVTGTIPSPDEEPGRVVFEVGEHDTYKLDPRKIYFWDVVITDSDGTSNPQRPLFGSLEVIGGPNNNEAGGTNNE